MAPFPLQVLILLFCICSATQIQVFSFKDGLLPNGDFERGPKPSLLKGTQVIGHGSLPNWEISGFVEYIKQGHKQRDMLLVVPEGSFAIRLGNDAFIKQKMFVRKGMYYSLTLSVARTCAQEERLYVSVPPDFGVLPVQTLYTSNGWDSYAWAFVARSNEIDIVIHNPSDDTEDPSCGPIVDAVAMKRLKPPNRIRGNALVNGDFEEGPIFLSKSSAGVMIPPSTDDDDSPLVGWSVQSLKSVRYIDSSHYAVPQGQRAVELLAGKESVLAQVARTVPGPHVLTFAVGDANNTCKGSMVVEAYAGSASVHVPYESRGMGGFKHARLTFVATSERTTIVFLSSFYSTRTDDLSTLCGPIVDDVRLVRVRAGSRG